MALCKNCTKRRACVEICPELKKELSARGLAPRQKDKTYSVDMNYLENSQNPFNEFQKEAAKELVSDEWDDVFTQLDFAEVMDKVLSVREKQIIHLILERYTQQEIAEKLNISKPRVNVILQRARKKIKNFYRRG
ncbi:MAG: sigma-70 family RNA polymerase sigma factor [Candidatus Omnitrophota bacterium]